MILTILTIDDMVHHGKAGCPCDTLSLLHTLLLHRNWAGFILPILPVQTYSPTSVSHVEELN